MLANNDTFTNPVDVILRTNVSSNDANVTPLTSFKYVLARQPTYIVPGGNTSMTLASLVFSADGAITWNPVMQVPLQPGTVVTFAYYIQVNSASAARSNNATVTITLTPPGG